MRAVHYANESELKRKEAALDSNTTEISRQRKKRTATEQTGDEKGEEVERTPMRREREAKKEAEDEEA